MSDYATSQSNAYANFIPEVWSQKLAVSLDNSGVMMQCVNKNYEGDIAAAGDTVKIRSFGDVSVSSYTGTISSYSELTASSVDLIVDQSKAFAFKVNDIAKAQANINIVDGYIQRAKIAVDLVKDQFLLAKHVDAPADNVIGEDAAPVIITSSNIYAQFVGLAKKLKNANAITTGQTPWVVINPEIEALLLQSTEFTHASNIGDKTLREGSIGKIAGMDVLVCTNLTATTVDTDGFDGDLYYVLAGTNDAITFASSIVNVETLRDTSSFADLVRGLYVYGAKTIVPNALAKLVCTTTSYTLE
ncbi:MAG: hypothetical protein PHV68_09505 [Candidatus Gastranaerophilales bacterium]|nr:hypothetical protein [Candidatus Gastranaerophilales bacterium]